MEPCSDWVVQKLASGEITIEVTKHLTNQICKIYHDSITAGHLGFEKTFKAISSRFFWLGMKEAIFDYCQTCDTCQKFKPKNSTQKSPMVTIKVDNPWDLVGVDVAGPLKLTPWGNVYIFLAICFVSKFCITEATPTFTAEKTIRFLEKKLINTFGVPFALLSDQGRNFLSKAVEEFCQKHGIKKLRTTSYHPQCNGLAERTIKTIKQMLCAYVNKDHDNWDQVLETVTFAYNNAIHASTGFSPNQVIFGKTLPTPADRKMLLGNTMATESREKIAETLSKNIERAQASQKKQYDKKLKEIDFKVGDLVLLTNSRQTVGQVRSFTPKFLGPYEVTKKISDVNFQVKDIATDKSLIVHHNRMNKYFARPETKSIESIEEDWLEAKKAHAAKIATLRNTLQTNIRFEHIEQNKTLPTDTTVNFDGEEDENPNANETIYASPGQQPQEATF